jgi:predicted AAA+ superfamily ATPase
MIYRLIKPLKTQSFFLFGARGVGKSTYLKESFLLNEKNLYIDLLDDQQFDRYYKDHKLIEDYSEQKKYEWIIIDEIQKIPALLDRIHRCIEKYRQKFILTGSSARKIARGGANLLAGRANVYRLFPFSSMELKEKFNLVDVLTWGTLPRVYALETFEEKKMFLRSYAQTYLKEEIQQELILRKIDPFRDFLEIAAQSSGKILNFSSIARDVGVDAKTIHNYFQILEETYLGFFLPAFHRSIRKSQLQSPKFYFIDNGIKRTLSRELDQKVESRTSEYGELFESWVIQEIFRFNFYYELDYRLSFFATKHGVEFDLVLNRGKEIILIEIKSTSIIDIEEVRSMKKNSEDFPTQTKKFYLSNDPIDLTREEIHCCHWQTFLKDLIKK